MLSVRRDFDRFLKLFTPGCNTDSKCGILEILQNTCTTKINCVCGPSGVCRRIKECSNILLISYFLLECHYLFQHIL